MDRHETSQLFPSLAHTKKRPNFDLSLVWANCSVVCPRVMFTLVVRQIFLAGVPLKRINILCFLFTSPKISHLHCSRALLFDGDIGNPDGGCIIAVDGGFGLRVAKVFKSESKNHSFLAI